jgi:hypothetical protein
MPSERDRTRLIAELASLLHDCHLSEDARCASLTLIGWLARRMPGEAASTDGVEHARHQLEVHGLLPSCRAVASTETTLRVETRSIVVRTRRGRSNDAPSGREARADGVRAEERRLPPSSSADVPRPSAKKLASA